MRKIDQSHQDNEQMEIDGEYNKLLKESEMVVNDDEQSIIQQFNKNYKVKCIYPQPKVYVEEKESKENKITEELLLSLKNSDKVSMAIQFENQILAN